MAGYRSSSYDPEAGLRWGPPLRPYNLWQWLGVALTLVGAAIYALFLAGKMGWLEPPLDHPTGAGALVLAGFALTHSRRQAIADFAPELAPVRRRWLIITVTLCAVIIGAATIIEFTGA